jgi:hypothetical protein
MANPDIFGILPGHFEYHPTCTMKTRIVILGALVVVVIVLLWPLRNRKPISTEIAPNTSNVAQSIQTVSSNILSSATGANVGTMTPEEFAKIKPELEKRREALAEQALDEWKTPIQFYGITMDDSNNIVPGAHVDFSCNDISPTGNSFYHTTSDMNGSFAIKGIQGKLLQVSVNKDGYYSYDPHGKYFYYAGQNQNFVPDAGNPVVFRLKKKGSGEPLVVTDYPGFAHIAQLKHDGTAVELNLFDGTQVAMGNGQLNLQFWRDLSDRKAKLFNWKLQIAVPGGGLIETDEQFAFLAPDNGYQPQVIFDEPTNNPEWKGSLKNKYYLQLPDGKYGRIDFEFLPYNGTFHIHSVVNPSGSHDLEPTQ